MAAIYSIAVFCGSRSGNDPAYAVAARALGTGLADAGIRLVYGGGRYGMMGAMADAALASGGQVLGVIPDFLMRWEVAHPGLTRLEITDSMHSRKRRMGEEADAFVTLPGGIGTLDETIEVLTWRQLRLHDKPIYICDVAGSAGYFVAAIDEMIARGFMGQEAQAWFQVVDGVPALLTLLRNESGGRGFAAERV